MLRSLVIGLAPKCTSLNLPRSTEDDDDGGIVRKCNEAQLERVSFKIFDRILISRSLITSIIDIGQ